MLGRVIPASFYSIPLPAVFHNRQVGLREGQQSGELAHLITVQKLDYIHRSVDAMQVETNPDIDFEIEVGTFGSIRFPMLKPLADTDVVMPRIEKRPGVRYSAMVFNRDGFFRAWEVKTPAMAVAVALSEKYQQANTNGRTREDAFREIKWIADVNMSHHIPMFMRAYALTVYGDGKGSKKPTPMQVRDDIMRYRDMGFSEICLGDTTAEAKPYDVYVMFSSLREFGIPPEILAFHFHGLPGGHAIDNSMVASRLGINRGDTGFAWVGGNRASGNNNPAGNVGTGDFFEELEEQGVRTGHALEGVRAIEDAVQTDVERGSRVAHDLAM